VRNDLAAERELATDVYTAAVLDLGLPLRDGLAVLAAVRERGTTTPVLVLIARGAVPDRIRGLDLGADDCVVKPVDLHELAARLRGCARWCGVPMGSRTNCCRPTAWRSTRPSAASHSTVSRWPCRRASSTCCRH